MIVFLTGFMAAGKSRIGRELGTLLGYDFLDLDDQIELTTGASIPAIFAEEGEAGFRRRESEVLEAACKLDRTIVATGGGVVQVPSNIRLMRESGVVVWLDPPLEVILARLSRSPTPRPLFQSEDQVRKLYASRLEAYSECDYRIRSEEGDEARGVARRIGRLLDSDQ